MATMPAWIMERPEVGEFAGYLLASIVALVVDTALLLLLARWMHYLLAATIAFLCGMLVCYGLNVRYVFSARHYRHSIMRETILFFLVGLAGLVVNDAIILVAVARFSASLIVAKMFATAGSFLFNFGGRKMLLFRRN